MEYAQEQDIQVAAQVAAASGIQAGRRLSTHYVMEAHNAAGDLLWRDEFDNLVTTAGLNDSLTQHFKGVAYTAAWYVGITGTVPTFAAGDTMASHAGWATVTAYSGANRPAAVFGAVAAGSVDNSASKAQFTINANGTVVGGAFLVNDSTKGGTTGTLYGGGAMAEGDRTLSSGDVISVQLTLTASAS